MATSTQAFSIQDVPSPQTGSFGASLAGSAGGGFSVNDVPRYQGAPLTVPGAQPAALTGGTASTGSYDPIQAGNLLKQFGASAPGISFNPPSATTTEAITGAKPAAAASTTAASSSADVSANPTSEENATHTVKSPNGGTFTLDANNNVTNYTPGFSIDTSNPSTADISGNATPSSVAATQHDYLNAVHALGQAQNYSPAYMQAYQAYQNAQDTQKLNDINYQTDPYYGGLTTDQRETVYNRANALADFHTLVAGQAAQYQELLRQGNINQAAAVLQNLYKTLSPGQSVVNLGNGQTVSGGMGSYDNYQATQDFYNLAQQYPDTTPPYNATLSPQQNLQIAQQAAAQSQLFYKKGYIPYNAYSYFGSGSANPLQPDIQTALGSGAQNVLNAIQSNNLAPNAINSRNAGLYGALYSANPNFNQIQAQAGANFYESNDTQTKIAWAKTVQSDFSLLEKLSANVNRTNSPLINSAILKGDTEVAGDPNATAFVQAASRVASELSRVLGDSGGSDFRTQLAGAVLNPSFSPNTFSTVLGTEGTLINNMVTQFQATGGQPATGLSGSTGATSSNPQPSNGPIDVSQMNF